MKKLTVHYDAACGFCVRCRAWLEAQPKYLPLDFVPAPGADELTVVSDDGRLYRGPKAFVMCLYALREYRGRAMSLSNPMLWPLARAFFATVSANRSLFSPAAAVGAEEAAAAAASLPAAPAACRPQRPRPDRTSGC